MKRILQFIASVFLTLTVGGLSGYATIAGVEGWYKTLHKPSFNPPNYVFGPVWTLLYLLMGISFFLVWRERSSGKKATAVRFFLVQLLLNFVWSIIFFNLHFIGWALLDILLLWLTILMMIRQFYRINKLSAMLQLPYICWVSFATALNAAIYYLN